MSYCFRSQIVYYRYLLYTFVKVHSTAVGGLGALGDLRGLGVGGHGMGKLSKSVFNPNRVWAKI